MCGFAGFIDLKRNIEAADLHAIGERMGESIAHRGPDDAQVWVDAPAGLAMAFRRLSIIDLSPTGSQPMHSASGRSVVVFNGEVYNAPALRQELAAEGARFRGRSDTEVILEAFERWGIEGSLGRLEGMFAIAFWERERRRLSLIRDRLGKKPLYFGSIDGTFYFGSQPKSFARHPAWRAAIDRDSLAAFMRFGYVPSPRSIFKGISQLRPGEWVEIAGAEIVGRRRYWDAREQALLARSNPFELGDEEAIAHFEQLLGDAVEKRLVSDVPIGAFLSGGIDSSAVVALMQRRSAQRVRTFSIGFDEAEWDEAPHARAVAEHLGTEHNELRVRPRDCLDAIPAMALYYDEPFADASQIPTYLLCRLTRAHVTVALSGDGGDELFAGYERYRRAGEIVSMAAGVPVAARPVLARAIAAVPDALWNMLEPLVPRRLGHTPLASRARKFADLLSRGGPEHVLRGLVGQWPEPCRLVRNASEPVEEIWNGSLGEDFPELLRRLQLIDTLTYLPDDILVKVDRASMAVGLEARAPLLDHSIAEFSWRLPSRFLVRNGETKWLLRQVLFRHVPRGLIERPKMGFMFPIDAWLRGPLREWAEDLLDANRMESDGLLDPGPVRALWDEHVSGKGAWHYRLWCVLMFQAWKREWLDAGGRSLASRNR